MVRVVQPRAVTHREDAVGEEPHDRAGHPRKGQSPAAVEPIACTPSSSFAISETVPQRRDDGSCRGKSDAWGSQNFSPARFSARQITHRLATVLGRAQRARTVGTARGLERDGGGGGGAI